MHRFMWDMRHQPVPDVAPDYPIAAVYRNTAAVDNAPWAMPGQYTIVLTAGGKSYTQPLVLKIDPRVKSSNADLALQFELSKQLYDEWLRLQPLNQRLNSLSAQLASLRSRAGMPEATAKQIDTLNQKLQELAGAANRRPGAQLSLLVLTRAQTLFRIIQEADVAPSTQVAAAVAEIRRDASSLLERWRAIETQDIPALNRQLQDAGVPQVEAKESREE
jgi:hypothetical protein